MRIGLAPVVLTFFLYLGDAADLWRNSCIRVQDIPLADRSFGESNLKTVSNPAGGNENVLRVEYPKNSYKPSASPRGGAQFFIKLSSPCTEVSLTYDIYFDRNFDFVKGGKLPGLYGGTKKCSGGRSTERCFSTRYMFRRDGKGEVYLYAPQNQRNNFCNDPNVKCNFRHGHSLGRGRWIFQTGKWYTIKQTVRLNTVGQQNGYINVWLNHTQVLSMTNLNFRNSGDVKIEGMFFSTFFGGSDRSWATPRKTYTYYRNFKMTT